jgi:hypothetical protein
MVGEGGVEVGGGRRRRMPCTTTRKTNGKYSMDKPQFSRAQPYVGYDNQMTSPEPFNGDLEARTRFEEEVNSQLNPLLLCVPRCPAAALLRCQRLIFRCVFRQQLR